MQKPYAESCDQNGPPLLAVLRRLLPAAIDLLEIGSGTGQHAVMFAQALPGVNWFTSDRAEMHAGIHSWLDEVELTNLHRPIALDVLHDPWPARQFDAAFSANTAHIMPPTAVEAMFTGVARILRPGGLFLLYGPFKYDREHTSESNLAFDNWLKTQDPQRGVRDVRWLQQLAEPLGMELADDIAMPTNNRTLVWRRRLQ